MTVKIEKARRIHGCDSENVVSHPLNFRYTTTLIALALIILTIAVYAQVIGHQFVNYDDDHYIFNNPQVKAGLTMAGIKWAFTTDYFANWHPLTWISHMTDVSLFGMNAGGHHAVNLAFHILNAVILFLVLYRITGARWKSAFVAAMFAIHPLHVESVAWAAERKDVLSLFFGLLTLWAYVRYAERPGLARYLAVFALFTLTLLAKSMLVTLPILMLLLDYWPMNRVGSYQSSVVSYGDGGKIESGAVRQPRYPRTALILEKVPLFSLSVVSAAITRWAQCAGGAVGIRNHMQHFPLSVRVDYLIVGYAHYLLRMLWPTNLAIPYVHPGYTMPIWWMPGALCLLTAVTILAILLRRSTPFLAVGWGWYLFALAPLIGVIVGQVGDQTVADRFSYVPLIGIFITVAWGLPEVLRSLGLAPAIVSRVLTAVSTTAVLACSVVCFVQASYWQDSTTLLGHTLQVTKNNSRAEDILGRTLSDRGQPEDAIQHFTKAIEIDHSFDSAFANRGLAFMSMGKMRESIADFDAALALREDSATLDNRGVAYIKLGKLDLAEDDFNHALRIDKSDAVAFNNLGQVFILRHDPDSAKSAYRSAIRIKPDYAKAYENLGMVLSAQKQVPEAIEILSQAVRLDPASVSTRTSLGVLLVLTGKYDAALSQCMALLRQNPQTPQPYGVMAMVYFYKQDYTKSWENVHKCLDLGGSASPEFMAALSRKMPDPSTH